MTAVDAARAALDGAREDLARLHQAQDPERHFTGAGEDAAVVAALDRVKEAEAALRAAEARRAA